MIFVYIGENCLQLYAQSAVFLIHCFLSRKTEFLVENEFAMAPADGYARSPAGKQQLVSLTVSWISALAAVIDALDYFTAIREVVDEGSKHWDDLSEKNKQIFRHVWRSRMIVRFGMLIVFWSLFLTAAKLVAGLFLCADVMWNMSEVFKPSRGC